MHRAILIAVLYLLGLSAVAKSKPDSLRAVWNDASQSDTNRLNAMRKLLWTYMFNEPDSAFYFAQLQYDYAERVGVKKSMASARYAQGVSLALRGENADAIHHLTLSLNMMEEIGDKDGIANALNAMGNIYTHQGTPSKAIDYYTRCLRMREELGDDRGIASTLHNVGVIYFDQGDYPKALEYFERSRKIAEETHDSLALSHFMVSIGNAHGEQKDYAQALEYYFKSLSIAEKYNDSYTLASLLYNIGSTYFKQGHLGDALDYLNRGLALAEKIEDQRTVALSQNEIGSTYHQRGDYASAIAWCSRGLKTARDLEALIEQKSACKCLYDAYKATGNESRALEYHEQMLSITDSLEAEEIAKKLDRMEFAKEVLADSLEREAEMLQVQLAHEKEVRKKNRTRNVLVVSGLFLLVAAGGFYSRMRIIRSSRKRLAIEKDRSENLLLNILPAEIAEELKTKGEAVARDFDKVSILFTDFKEFTQTSEKMSATELVAEINTCFKAFDDICGTHGIEKIKTIGDAYMAAGGLPVADNQAAHNTVLTGLEMAEFIVKRKAAREAEGKIGFEMRVGIHSGPVVAGIVGVKKFQYDVWGDTVNTASRMENHGEVSRVNISQETYDLIRNDAAFTFESRGKLQVKGKGEVEMYFVNLKS